MNNWQYIILGGLAFVLFLVVFIAWLYKERDLYLIFPQEIIKLEVSHNHTIVRGSQLTRILDNNNVDYERVSDGKTKYVLIKKPGTKIVHLFTIESIDIRDSPLRNSHLVTFVYDKLIYTGEEAQEYFDRNRNFLKTIITR
jgi:hypothetical protein